MLAHAHKDLAFRGHKVWTESRGHRHCYKYRRGLEYAIHFHSLLFCDGLTLMARPTYAFWRKKLHFEGKLAPCGKSILVRDLWREKQCGLRLYFCYGCFGFRLDKQVWNKKPATLQPLLSLSFSFVKTPMRTPIASYSLFVLSFVISVKTSPLVNLPSPLVLNFANGNNTGPRLPSNTTYLINDTLNMNTV